MRNKKIDLNEKLRKVSCDVFVIGGGGAGLRAAIGAHDFLAGPEGLDPSTNCSAGSGEW